MDIHTDRQTDGQTDSTAKTEKKISTLEVSKVFFVKSLKKLGFKTYFYSPNYSATGSTSISFTYCVTRSYCSTTVLDKVFDRVVK